MFIHNSFQIIYTYEFVRTVHVTNGVRQGGVLSPYFGCIFYDLFLELNNIKAECCIGEVLLNHLMFQEGIHAEIACPITFAVGKAVDSEVPSSDSDSNSWQFRLSDSDSNSDSDSGPTPTFSCISYLK